MSNLFNYIYEIKLEKDADGDDYEKKNINLLCNNKYGTIILNIPFGYCDDKLNGIVKEVMFLGEYKNGVQHGVEVIYDVGGVYSLSKYVNGELSGWGFVIDEESGGICSETYHN